MELRSEYVPLAWYNSGYNNDGSTQHILRRASSPPPPYMERDPKVYLKDVHPALRYQHKEKPIIYASVRPSLPRLRTTSLDQSPPGSPTSVQSTPVSKYRCTFSDESDSSSIRSESSFTSSSTSGRCSPKTLRRSARRARGMSLRELRQKQSEADLLRVYTSAVDEYLNGDLFEKFRAWAGPAIMESNGESYG